MMVAWWSLFLYGLQVAAPALAAPQFSPTVNTEGIIPISERPSPTQSSSSSGPVIPAGSYVSDFDASGLANLWSQVEVDIPVESPRISAVPPLNKTFSVPKTPVLPNSLQDHLPKDVKAPEGFAWGVASVAQQYEGAVKADGRGPSHWDFLCHRNPSSCTNYTSDITDLGRYYYKNDLARMAAMGITHYSFSVSWTRVVPFGKKGSPVSNEGLDYYEDICKTALSFGIKPVITLFHWDTPANLLFEYGGFLNGTIVDDYYYYADIVFRRLGKYAETFFTFNEPRVYCSEYTGPPFDAYYERYGLNSSTAPYPCSYNLLRAHGAAVGRYRALVKEGSIKSGEIAFKNDDSYQLPQNPDSDADKRAAKRHFDFYIGIFSQPVYGNGYYPETVRNTISERFLPEFTAAEREQIQGSADFYAIDGYRTNIASAAPNGIDACLRNASDPNWPVCQDNSNTGQYATLEGFALGPPADPNANWLYNTAPYLRYQFKVLKENFNYKKIYLTEFGFAEPFSYLRQDLYALLYDTDRTAYYQDYLAQCMLAIKEDGIPLAGVFAWSFVDNFEWGSGLEQRFGMQYVNYTDPDLPRTFKLSFLAYRDFIKNHKK
nr:beta-glycosidase [eukaryotic synthetic construct]